MRTEISSTTIYSDTGSSGSEHSFALLEQRADAAPASNSNDGDSADANGGRRADSFDEPLEDEIDDGDGGNRLGGVAAMLLAPSDRADGGEERCGAEENEEKKHDGRKAGGKRGPVVRDGQEAPRLFESLLSVREREWCTLFTNFCAPSRTNAGDSKYYIVL